VTESGFLPNLNDPSEMVEYFISKPAGAGPWPTIILVHGHQDEVPKPGAKALANAGRLTEFARRGWVAIALSQPGYGRSDGPPDFCGPLSQAAIRAVIAHARRLSFVDPKRIALDGVSRGAVASALVAAQDPSIAALVLRVGVYDLVKAYSRLRERQAKLPPLKDLADSIELEAGTSFAELRARSVLHLAERIKAPTLILAGAQDPMALASDARELARRIKASGTPARAIIFEDAGHRLRSRRATRRCFPSSRST
jgi:dipeptidyl aminopeptidase/acylaminoacyl peptidase